MLVAEDQWRMKIAERTPGSDDENMMMSREKKKRESSDGDLKP